MALTPGQIVASLAPIVGRVGAAGVAGNTMQESSDTPGRAGGDLAQWQGSRYQGLVDYARSHGVPLGSGAAALGYLAQDLKGPYKGLAAQLRAAKTPQQAADLFSNIYERPGIPMLANRERYAAQALGGKGAGIKMPSQGGPVQIDQGTSTQGHDWTDAGVQAFLRAAAAPIDTSGKVSATDHGLLSNMLNNYNQQPTTKTTITTPGGGITLPKNIRPYPSGTSDINPLHHFTIGRTDMGVDANAKPGTPILAPNDAKVVGVMPNWYNGQPYVALRLLDGPNKGKVMYVAEQITGVPHVGAVITRGQPIARYAQSGTGIEIGWADPNNWQQTLAQGTHHDNANQGDHANTPAGVNFRNWLGSLK